MSVSSDAVETLTSQFQESEITKNFLASLLSPFDEIESALQYLLNYTNLEYGAEGVWLDKEGEIVGTKRLFDEIPDDNIFTFLPGDETFSSPTKGFDGGYLRSLLGNYIPGTQMSDEAYTIYTQAKANATFKGTSLRDIVDFVYDVFGVICSAEFVTNSDVYVTLDSYLPYSSKRIIEQYAPVSAGSVLYVL
jgi:hypothetical protein